MADMDWGPYGSQGWAWACLTRFAGQVFDPGFGVAWATPTGAVVRHPPAYDDDGLGLMLCVACHGPVPPVIKDRKPPTFVGRIEDFCMRLMADYGRQQYQQAMMEQEAAQRVDKAIVDHVWKPVNRFLEEHKIVADGVAAGLDAVGVLAAAGLFVAVAAGTVALSPFALAAGAAAGFGSLILLGIDGTVFAFEANGNKAAADALEDNSFVEWSRVGATVLLLPDLAYGGIRALREVRALPAEIREQQALATESVEKAAQQRERTSIIRNPEKHPGPVQRHLARANRLERAAAAAQTRAAKAQRHLEFVIMRDLPASWIGAPAATGLLIGSPPRMWREHGAGPQSFDTSALGAPSRGGLPLQSLAPHPGDDRFPSLTQNLEMRVGVCARPDLQRH